MGDKTQNLILNEVDLSRPNKRIWKDRNRCRGNADDEKTLSQMVMDKNQIKPKFVQIGGINARRNQSRLRLNWSGKRKRKNSVKSRRVFLFGNKLKFLVSIKRIIEDRT
jgi:hypothetical protein